MATAEWTIPGLLELAGGYWSSCALHCAVKFDIFSSLDGAAMTAPDVARLCSTDVRATGMLLDALASLGLLEKENLTYRSTPFAEASLSKRSPGYLGHIIMHHHHLMEGWSRLDEAVSAGGPIMKSVSRGTDDTVRESFLMGMFNLASLLAPRVAQTVSLSGRRTLLDLGGGPGTYAIHFCLANPQLRATVYDLPTTRKFAEKTIDRFGLADRISFTSGDYHADPLPTGFDTAWLSHILHSDPAGACTALLSATVAALNSGGILMVQEFIMNDDKSGPPFPALFSLNMLLGTDAGQSYSECELISMMKAAGLTGVTRLAIDLPNGAGVLMGCKPDTPAV